MTRRRTDLSGKTFNRLTVISYIGDDKYLCICICKNCTNVNSHDLKRGHTKSCGCLRNENVSNINKSHKLSKTKEYRTWNGIKDRCYNKNSAQYKDYGGRGITVCERWLNSFETFLNDVGERPSPKSEYSLDRINVNGNYCKENCRWATRVEQNNNARSNISITFLDKTQNAASWAKEYGISPSTLYNRIRRGWTIEKALTTPNLRNVILDESSTNGR